MGRSPCCSKEGLNRGAWTSIEDQTLTAYIKAHGEGNWRNLPNRAGLKRCGKSCRLRWLNYLRPDIKRGNISGDEEDLIARLHRLLGNRWSLIAGRLPGRTDNEIKNYWNTTLAKKAKDQSSSSSTHGKATAQHQIIQTRATRCAKAVRLPENNGPEMDPLEPRESQDCGLKMDHIAHHQGNDLGFLYFDQFLGVSDDVVGANNNLSSMDAHDQKLFMDKPFFEDWAANVCLEDHDNDLKSLAFFLNSSEWP